MFNKENFFIYSEANWTKQQNEETINTKPDYTSGSGSKYWYTEDGVYRYSDHWYDGVASCNWFLNNEICKEYASGFCKWEDFKDVDTEITVYFKKEENYSKLSNCIIFDNYDNTKMAYITIKMNRNMIKDGRIYYKEKSIGFNPKNHLSMNYDFEG